MWNWKQWESWRMSLNTSNIPNNVVINLEKFKNWVSREVCLWEWLWNKFAIFFSEEDITSRSETFMSTRKDIVNYYGDQIDTVLCIWIKTPYMRVLEKDMTESTMCGNGIRVVALLYNILSKKNEFEINTNAWLHIVKIYDQNNISVGMKEFIYEWMIDYYADKIFQVHYWHVWEPHAVITVWDDYTDIMIKNLLGTIWKDFTQWKAIQWRSINLNIIRKKEASRLDIFTYERWVENITQACGTWSTVAAYIAHKFFGCDEQIIVTNQWWDLTINTKKGTMTWPARVRL